MLQYYKMQLCFLLEKEADAISFYLNQKLNNLKEGGIISCYTEIDELHLGFPFLKPTQHMVIYRVDKMMGDLDNRRYFWKNLPAQELKGCREFFYNPAKEFFQTEDITRWTNELDALTDKDKELKNELTEKASSLINDIKGYIMVRAVVSDRRLEELEKELDNKYLKSIINI